MSGKPSYTCKLNAGKVLEEAVAAAQPAKTALEIGPYCGYSAVRVARLLPPGAKLVGIDPSEVPAKVAAPILDHAGQGDLEISSKASLCHEVGCTKICCCTAESRRSAPCNFPQHASLQCYLAPESPSCLRASSRGFKADLSLCCTGLCRASRQGRAPARHCCRSAAPPCRPRC